MDPLRIVPDRFSLGAAGLIAFGLIFGAAAYIAPAHGLDWADVRAGGATAGTPYIFDHAHHPLGPFVYPPAVAWLFVPAARISTELGFTLNVIIMLCACVTAAIIAAGVYRLPITTALLAVIAWVPATQAGFMGQFTPVALVLTLLAIRGLIYGNELLAGAAIGLLLYKPPDALPFLLLLLVRRRWSALAVASVAACCWYLASVAATSGSWLWPREYLLMLHNYYPAEFARTAIKTVSIPGLLVHLGASPLAASLASLGVYLCAVPRMAKARMLEAASFVPLVGLAAGVHAYVYETVLIIPALLLLLVRGTEPWRTRLVVASYLIAPLWILATWIRFDPLAIVTLSLAALWIVGRMPLISQDAFEVSRPIKGSAPSL